MQLERREIYEALQNEALARCKYEIYAEIAHEEGLHYFGKILEETARNELSHVREFMRLLGLLNSTEENLMTSIDSESNEAEEVYPRLHDLAMADGELEAGRVDTDGVRVVIDRLVAHGPPLAAGW